MLKQIFQVHRYELQMKSKNVKINFAPNQILAQSSLTLRTYLKWQLYTSMMLFITQKYSDNRFVVLFFIFVPSCSFSKFLFVTFVKRAILPFWRILLLLVLTICGCCVYECAIKSFENRYFKQHLLQISKTIQFCIVLENKIKCFFNDRRWWMFSKWGIRRTNSIRK